MAHEDEKKQPFTVKDRRRFDASGNRRQEEDAPSTPAMKEPQSARRPAAPTPPPAPAARSGDRDRASPSPAPSPSGAGRSGRTGQAGPAPSDIASRYDEELGGGEGEGGSLNFAEFVLSIATNAVLHLGGDAKDGRIPSRVNLPLAAQHIDIIAMLKNKTKGNLDQDEAELLDALLYDLRMKYVAVAQAQGQMR